MDSAFRGRKNLHTIALPTSTKVIGKIFELRLYDEKRQMLQIGDKIEFSCLDGNEEHFAV